MFQVHSFFDSLKDNESGSDLNLINPGVHESNWTLLRTPEVAKNNKKGKKVKRSRSAVILSVRNRN